MNQKVDSQKNEMVEHLMGSLHLSGNIDQVSSEMLRGVCVVTHRAESGRITRYVPLSVYGYITSGSISSIRETREWLICSTRNIAIDQIVRATTLGASVISRRLVMSEAVEQMWAGK